MKRTPAIPIPAALLICAFLIHGGCAPDPTPAEPAGYRASIESWQKKRNEGLRKETGWLTLAGLGWLSEGENPVGGDSSNTIVLPPGRAPGRIGSIFLEGGKITFRANGSAEVTHDGKAVREIGMQPDTSPEPTILRTGTLSFYVIERGDKMGVRIKDTEHANRLNFKGLEFFPIDPKWRFEAKFEPYVPPKFLVLPTQAGTIQRDSCPGVLVFDIGDTTVRLDAVIERGAEDNLFIMFADGTSGEETYGVGRQMYTELPDSNNRVIIDFNMAFNWPCVYTPFATCPLTPRQNIISRRIEAGEKMYHATGH